MQHTSGRNTIETISSGFSVNAIARPPSRGTTSPAKNALKIACAPITSVKNAEPRRVVKVAVLRKGEGPLWMDPVVRANHRPEGEKEELGPTDAGQEDVEPCETRDGVH